MKIAYCGLICDSCPIHLATLEQEFSRKLALRAAIAQQCSSTYGLNLKVEDVTDCDGCTADCGRLFSGCINCEVRKCAILKNIESCAYCSDYICRMLEEHFSLDPSARIRLEQIRKTNQNYKRNVLLFVLYSPYCFVSAAY